MINSMRSSPGDEVVFCREYEENQRETLTEAVHRPHRGGVGLA
jgi:hypothetical protein